MRKRSRRNKRVDAPHVRLYRWMLDTPAYLSLSCQERAVLVEIARAYDGNNNGRIGLSVRRAAERCNIAKDTASRAFKNLVERGFVDCVTRGAFSRKSMHATEWRLTWWPCDVTGELPSKRFMNWGKQNPVPKYTDAVPNGDHLPAKFGAKMAQRCSQLVP
jgi:MarR family